MTISFLKTLRLPVLLVCVSIAFPSDAVPDFAAIGDIKARKEAFVEFLVPEVRVANDEIWAERMTILNIRSRTSNGLTDDEKKALYEIGAQYGVPSPMKFDDHYFRVLLRRVDVVPAALVLAQAANETGWGISRFAMDANNFFGMWCYRQGCGLVPEQRSPGARHEVRRFSSVRDSVRAYLRNINSTAPFARLHEKREALRDQGIDPSAVELADGLDRYSERRAAYVKEIKMMILQNQLHRYTLFREPNIGS